jgi:hypothetical protein
MSDYRYTDPRGRRSGPYTEAELKLLASRDLLEADGVIELERAPGSGWRVADVPWLRAATTELSGVGVPTPPPPPPPDMASEAGAAPAAEARPQAEPSASPEDAAMRGSAPQAPAPQRSWEGASAFAIPPKSIEEFATRPAPVAESRGDAGISRALYVLLAILPPFIGLFGIHNVVAGYTTRGLIALILSLATFGGLCCIVAPPCACVSVPVWIVLFTMAVIEAFTVRFDAKQRRFS